MCSLSCIKLIAMKKSFLIVATLFALSATSYAQTASVDEDDDIEASAEIKKGGHPKSTPEERAKRQSQKFKEKFGLTDDQTAKLYEVFLARAQKTAQAEKEAKEKWKAEREANETKIKSILTPEQYTAYTKWKEEKKGHGKEHAKGHGKKK